MAAFLDAASQQHHHHQQQHQQQQQQLHNHQQQLHNHQQNSFQPFPIFSPLAEREQRFHSGMPTSSTSSRFLVQSTQPAYGPMRGAPPMLSRHSFPQLLQTGGAPSSYPSGGRTPLSHALQAASAAAHANRPQEFSEFAWMAATAAPPPPQMQVVRRSSSSFLPSAAMRHSFPPPTPPPSAPSGIRLNEDGEFSYSPPKTTPATAYPQYHHHNHDSGMMLMGTVGLPEMDEFVVPEDLPVILAIPEDRFKLSVHQVFLRHQIEAFKATDEEITTHTRGRNKQIKLGQVGIRCRHCAYLPVAMKQKGSVYFPATLLGLYQAAQNMSATHLQCGLCSQTPLAIKRQFVALMPTRAFSSGAGRPYWAQAAKKLGLVDTEDGIRFARDLPPPDTTTASAHQKPNSDTP